MGIILMPLQLAMLIGFSYHGIRLAVRAMPLSRGRAKAATVLAIASAVLALLYLIVPFALISFRSVPAGTFIVALLCSVACIAGVLGTCLKDRFSETGNRVEGLFGAAFFLAAGCFPIAWLTLAERLSSWFHITWIY